MLLKRLFHWLRPTPSAAQLRPVCVRHRLRLEELECRAVPSAASLIHQYDLNGSPADALGGPSLAADGGTLNATNYSFDPNQGLTLSGGLPNGGDYSIEMTFRLGEVDGFRKLIDFKDRAADDGLYNVDTSLQYFPVLLEFPGAFLQDQDVHLVLTRDAATKQVTAYINAVQAISFIDAADRAVFNAPGNVIHFFEDDAETGFEEASPGVVDRISIYNGTLTHDQVTMLYNGGSLVQHVQIDARPVSLNLASQGRISVAILTTDDFDASTVDASTVDFANASAVASALEDVDGDGDLDMVLQFNTQATNLRSVYEQLLAQDANADGVLDSTRQVAQVSLTGQTVTGQGFDGVDQMNLFLSGRALRDLLNQMHSNGVL